MRTRKLQYPQWMLDEIVDKSIIPKIYSIPTKTKILFQCPICGLEYYQTIHNHIKSNNTPKQGCPNCAKSKQATSNSLAFKNKRKEYPQWFIDELVNEEDKKKAKDGDIKSSDTLLFYCNKCGKEYKQKVASHITLSTGEKKKGCPYCGKEKQIESSRKSKDIIKPYPQWFIDELYLEKDREYAKTHNFYGYEVKQFFCKKHGLVYTKKVQSRIDLKTHKSKCGCKKCILENKPFHVTVYPQWFIDELYLEKDKEKARNGLLKCDDVVSFNCSIHGIYTRSVKEHIILSTREKKRGCPKCGYASFYKSLETKRIYPQWFIDELYLEKDKEKARKGQLKSTDTVEFVCSNGHVYSQIIKSHIILSKQESNKGCPYCFNSRSKIELEIEDFIKSLDLITEHRSFHSSLLNKFELDIYIPEKNIGLEYNGSYYHRTYPVGDNSKDKMYHNKKYYACKELGIHLISIFESDWVYRKEKIKQYLKDILLDSKRIYARKTEIKKVDSNTANNLYNQYHLLGKTTVQSISYGLYYNNELLACMSFQKGRYKENKNPVWCLTRFVTVSGYSIIGGASKLLTQFEKEYKPDILVSYSDNDYFNGGVYSKLGFTCLGDTNSPRYYWWLNNKELNRERCQLKHLSKYYPELYIESENKGNREDYIMIKLGAFKVYRSGHTKWIKRYSR